jgi:hypothetical protein
VFPLTGELDSLGMRAPRPDDREVGGLESLFFQNPLRKNHSEAVALSALEEPIRAELFSAERRHAESLAAAQRVTTTPRKGRPLLPRVLDNGRVLLESYRAIAQAIREERAIPPSCGYPCDGVSKQLLSQATYKILRA